MSHFSRFFITSILTSILLLATVAFPASARDFELSAFGAVRDGNDLSFNTGIVCATVIGVDCPSYASVDDSSRNAWVLGAAVQLTGPWWLDLRWSQDDGADVLFFEDRALSDPAPGRASLDVTYLQGGIQYRFFHDRSWSAFVTAFGGVTQIESGASTLAQSNIDVEEASFGLGAGVLVELGAGVGLRFEARETWTDLPDEFFEDQLDQLEGSAGLRYRF